MIKIDTIGSRTVNVRGVRSADDKGWLVHYGHKEERIIDYLADTGGKWRLMSDGTLGRQTAGTGQVRAPRDAAAFEPWLRQHVSRHIEVYALD
jgi:hypothetical protein